MLQAFTACELTERTAKAYYCSLTLGKVNLLPEEAIESGKAFFLMLQSS
jgi:hypothetical protein